MYDIKPGQRVDVKWIDPSAGSHWVDADIVDRFLKSSCTATGWVHLVTDEGFVLTACYCEQPDDSRDLLLRQYLPWGCVEELWVIDV